MIMRQPTHPIFDTREFKQLPTGLLLFGAFLAVIAYPLRIWSLLVVGVLYCVPKLVPVGVIHRLFPSSEELVARQKLALWLIGATLLLFVGSSILMYAT